MPALNPELPNVDHEIIVNKSFTIALKHVGMIADLVARQIGKNDSAIVRQAIEVFYRLKNEEDNDQGER